MRLQILLKGEKFTISAIDLAQGGPPDCPAVTFLAQISQESRKSILNVLHRHAVAGPILNETKSRKLSEDIDEFKSRQGDRLLYFYSPGRRGETIVTHGFHKGRPLKIELRRAERLRRQYFQETD